MHKPGGAIREVQKGFRQQGMDAVGVLGRDWGKGSEQEYGSGKKQQEESMWEEKG